MRFLLRMAFWLTVILCLLPTGGSQPASKAQAPQMSASDAMTAARATVSDMRQFCERQADACVIGAQAAVAIGHRAQAGAKYLYEFLNEHLGEPAAETGTVTAGSTVPLPAARPSQHTLTPADLKPAWRGPQPGRERNRPA